MAHDSKRRRQAEHARRRREVAETVRESGGDPSEFVAEIRAAKGASQNAADSIFGIPLDEHYTFTEEEMREKHAAIVEAGVSSLPTMTTAERTPAEQEKFVRAIARKFQATEREPEHFDEHGAPGVSGIEAIEEEREEACALCRRDTTRRVLGGDGRKWCSGADSDSCIRIAQGRLGGAVSAGRSTLSGKLRPDGNCRRCGQPIKWVKTQRGKKMPVDVSPAPSGVAAFELVGAVNTLAFYLGESKAKMFAGDIYQSHFQTCEAGDR